MIGLREYEFVHKAILAGLPVSLTIHRTPFWNCTRWPVRGSM